MKSQNLLVVCCFCALFEAINGLQFNIGIVHNVQSMTWQNAHHAIDEWNNANTALGFSLNLIAPTDPLATADARFCDVVQHHLIALFVPISGSTVMEFANNIDENVRTGDLSRDDIMLVLSMCNRFKIPCIVDKHISLLRDLDYVVNVGLPDEVIGKALSELIYRLMWNSFLLIYRYAADVAEVANLLSVWHTVNGARTTIKMLQLPSDIRLYDAFLKYIREHLRMTNMVVHTNDLSTIHTFLVRARRLNMTESRYSYLFTSPDLRLLEEFFAGLDSAYHCNISGIQLVQRNTPLVLKSDLAITINAVNLIGNALKLLNEKRLLPEPQSLLCDADDDVWRDGEFFAENLREGNGFAKSTSVFYPSVDNDFLNSQLEKKHQGEKSNNIFNNNSLTIAAITRAVNERFMEVYFMLSV